MSSDLSTSRSLFVNEKQSTSICLFKTEHYPRGSSFVLPGKQKWKAKQQYNNAAMTKLVHAESKLKIIVMAMLLMNNNNNSCSATDDITSCRPYII